AEVDKQARLGEVTLIGKVDRIDRLPDGSALVIDYKTESLATTKERIKHPQEDTQLAFYAALLEDDTLSAAYLHVGEREGSEALAQPGIVALRDALVDSIRSDMAR